MDPCLGIFDVDKFPVKSNPLECHIPVYLNMRVSPHPHFSFIIQFFSLASMYGNKQVVHVVNSRRTLKSIELLLPEKKKHGRQGREMEQ